MGEEAAARFYCPKYRCVMEADTSDVCTLYNVQKDIQTYTLHIHTRFNENRRFKFSDDKWEIQSTFYYRGGSGCGCLQSFMQSPGMDQEETVKRVQLLLRSRHWGLGREAPT